MFKLPEEWIETSVKDVNFYKSSNVKPSDFPDETFELYSVPIFPTGKPEIITGKEIGSSKQSVEPGDVLVCKINPRINRVWQVAPKGNYRQIASSEWIVVRQKDCSTELLRYYYSSHRFRELLMSDVSGVGGSLTRARPKIVETYPTVLPPLAEQKVIAAKLDSLLSQVEQIKGRIDAVPAILKKFRQSVLASAVSGKLTEQWRGSEELVGWEDKKLSDISNSISDGDHQAPPKVAEGIPFLVISNVSSGKIEFEKVERWVPEEYYQNLKDIRKPQKNDILYTVTGSFGIPVVVETDQSFCFQRHIGIIKPNNEIVDNLFLFYFLSSIQTYKQAEAVATGTAQKTVPLRGLRAINIPRPPLEEQKEIVRQVEKLFAFADTIEVRVKAAQSRVGNLTQSILAKAFRGDLTKEWREANRDLISGENSAKALLERIKEERVKLAPKKKRAVRKKK